jgi:hypothetical protein
VSSELTLWHPSEYFARKVQWLLTLVVLTGPVSYLAMIAIEMPLELGMYANIKCADTTTELRIGYGYACYWDIRRSHVPPPPPPTTSHQPREPQPIKYV